MQTLAIEFRSLIATSQSFQKLLKNRKTVPESLFKFAAAFLNRTKVDELELNRSTRELRDALFDMLNALSKVRIPSSLQSEVSP